ncbi:MAG: hypothetical protein K2L83_00555 [Muribaculaceae bacterium]|nr:hypothetical protein [Muribaculaceae bacterium]
MKKLIFSAFLFLVGVICIHADVARMPKIMIFPSDDWCKSKGYMLDAKTPDYERALNDVDMDSAVAVLGDKMAGDGFVMFSLKQELKQLHTIGAYDMAVTSKNDGLFEESARDQVTRNVGVDFIVELSLTNKPYGVRRAVEFKAQTIDAASNKILHGDVGSSDASSAPIPTLIRQVVNGFSTNFFEKIILAFRNIENNGREGSIIFKIADDCPLNFESEITVDGESGELADYIEYWLGERAVGGACSRKNKSRESLQYDQVRFPLFGKVAAGGFGSKKGKEKALTMESFVAPIAQDLKPFNVSVTTVPIGQGTVYVMLGGL